VSTEERIKQLLAANLTWAGAWEEVDSDYPLLARQVIDSLGLLNVISALEAEFGIEIDDADVVPDNWRTIADVARLVESKR
jgi:acyl carrier protein